MKSSIKKVPLTPNYIRSISSKLSNCLWAWATCNDEQLPLNLLVFTRKILKEFLSYRVTQGRFPALKQNS